MKNILIRIFKVTLVMFAVLLLVLLVLGLVLWIDWPW